MFNKMMAAIAGKAGFPNGLMGDEEPEVLDENGLPINLPMPGQVPGAGLQNSVPPPAAPVVNVATNTAEQAANQSIGQMVGQRMEGLRDIASDPGGYAMNQIGGSLDGVRGLVQDPKKYAADRFAKAMNPITDAEEVKFKRAMARMRNFQAEGESQFAAGRQAVQLPTGYFNSAQRGLM
tara:strand:- start:1027 stop:1563 length:537 start_codon:yes stop_codon:yes gene_type:complete